MIFGDIAARRSLGRPEAWTAEVERTIAGYTVLNDWTGRRTEAHAAAQGLPTSEAKDFATQLGPVLVTPVVVFSSARWRSPSSSVRRSR